ncbi:GNAT family N-acetyltransferase [Brachyspira hyodysenteriae]|nr:GNAT family N-acetyltransferase [Brachyspira hyodysenteriae]
MDNKPIAVISHGKSRCSMEGYGEIISLYVHPIYQGSGIGTLLLEHAVKYMKDLGYTNICLYVFEKNEKAKEFYQKKDLKILGIKIV